MPSARIHEAIAKELNKEKTYDELLLRLGTIAPDSWRNVEKESGYQDRFLTHLRDYRIKNSVLYGYKEFFYKYYDQLNNPFYFGYLIHLMGDQYWKNFIDPKYRMIQDGKKVIKLKDGTITDFDSEFEYKESLKMEKEIAKLYNLNKLPIKQEEVKNLECDIDELNLNGLFGVYGSLNYLNTEVLPTNNEQSLIYDTNDIINYIKETAKVIEKEIKNLEIEKEEEDKKVKIAIDLDDTILNTKEIEEEYLKNTPNKDLAKVRDEYREEIATNVTVKEGASFATNQLLVNGNRVDIVSSRPLNKNAEYKKVFVDNLVKHNVNYNFFHMGFYSKKQFLKDQHYDILIDDDIKNVMLAKAIGVTPILFGTNPNYNGYQTNNWNDIPYIVEEIKQNLKGKSL